MPDYGGGSSGKGPSLKNKYGSGNKASKARSRASERRKKNARQAAQRAAKALADQKKADAAKAISSLGMTGATKAIADQKKAQANLAAQRAARTPPEMSPRNIAAQQAAARQAAAAAARRDANRPSVIAARQAQMGSVKPKPRPTVTNKQNPIQKAYNDFLMDVGLREKTQDYYDRLSGRKDAAKREQDRLREKRQRDRRRARSDTTTPTTTTETTETTTTLPPEIVDEFPPVMPPVMPPFRPQFPQYPGMGGGIGAFGYNPALLQFESQQGAGQVPYYMAAARNAQTPNMSPAFMHAARNYDILGGMQRTAPRPMEMMSAAERAQIAGMSNFSTPNYNSPYDQFNFFSNMVGGGGGKGMGRPAPQMAGGLAPFMMGMS